MTVLVSLRVNSACSMAPSKHTVSTKEKSTRNRLETKSHKRIFFSDL